MPAREDLSNRQILLDKAGENIIEHIIGRQGVLIRLIVAQFSTGRLMQDGGRNHLAIGAFGTLWLPAIAQSREAKDLHFIKVFDGIKPAIHIAINGRIPNRHFGFIASGHQHGAKFIGDRH